MPQKFLDRNIKKSDQFCIFVLHLKGIFGHNYRRISTFFEYVGCNLTQRSIQMLLILQIVTYNNETKQQALLTIAMQKNLHCNFIQIQYDNINSSVMISIILYFIYTFSLSVDQDC